MPHVMENLDLGYDVLKEWNPKIIMLSLPAFGQSGPYKYYRTLGAQLDSYMGGAYVEAILIEMFLRTGLCITLMNLQG